MNDWWLIIRVPGELHLYQLGDVDADAQAAAVAERSAQHGLPEDWLERGEGWERSLTVGEPHPKLLAQATTVTRLDEAA